MGPGAEDTLDPRALFPLSKVLALQWRRRDRSALSQAGASAHCHGGSQRRVSRPGQCLRRTLHRERWPRHPGYVSDAADYPTEWALFLVSTLTNDAGLPDRIFGKYGTMDLGGDVKMKFNGAFQEEFTAKNDDKLETSIAAEPRRDLEGNWIDAMRGNCSVFCNADLGCATMVAIKMAVESYRQRKTMLWDAKREKVYTA